MIGICMHAAGSIPNERRASAGTPVIAFAESRIEREELRYR